MQRSAPVLAAAVLLAGVVSAQTLTYVDLVDRLTDLRRLATLPAPGEVCAQASSYDRASRYDEATGKYVAWDANGDGDGFVRKEGEAIVMADLRGPGCLWRIWSAAPKDGHVRIYLDGSDTPAVDLPFMGYFDLKNAPFTRPALVHTVAMGWNNYTPIPFLKSCKIVADPGWGQYYQFVYTTFPEGTLVPTFQRSLSAAEASALDHADRLLAGCGPDSPPPDPSDENRTFEFRGMPGATGAMEGLAGPGAITLIRARFDAPVGLTDRHALREWSLAISWDDERQPAVWAPLGDFFGTAGGPNPYRSLPSGVTADGWFYSRWFMPFARSARLTLRNEGEVPRTLRLEVFHSRLTGDPGQWGRFHAKWHRDVDPPAEPGRAIDWTLLKTAGRGRFVGVMLHVFNPRGAWWGEGDEKFFVDGEKFPSTFGTGSEDYFGYAWCNPSVFQHAYHNQPVSMNNRGHICVNRWHIPDNIPFQKSFEGAIEKYFPNERPTHYASTAFWYQEPGKADHYERAALESRTNYWTEVTRFTVRGAREGEKLQVLECTGGQANEQALDPFGEGWSNEAQLWWIGAKSGHHLDLMVPVEKAGKYRVKLQFTKAPDYGIVQVAWDGRKLGAPLDLYHPDVRPTGELDFGELKLKTGEHRLGLEILGTNPKAKPSFMVGLDYVRLEPVEEPAGRK